MYKQIIGLVLSGLILSGILVVQSLGRFADRVPSVLNLLSERSGIWYSARQLKKDNTQELTSYMINNSIELIRDKDGVIHIYAQNDHEAYTAMGWIMMHDRFNQLQLLPRFVSGTVSEMLGPAAESLDNNFLNLQLEDMVGSISGKMGEEESNRIQSFSNGANMYLSTLASAELPILFRYENLPMAYFKPSNVFRILLLWQYLNSFDYSDVALQQITNTLGATTSNRLYSDFKEVEVPLKERENKIDLSVLVQNLNNHDLERSRWVGDRTSKADLNLQLSQNRSSNDSRILAGMFSGEAKWPSLFYEVHIVTPRKNVYGLALVGTPFIFSGTNGKIAWNITSSESDFTNWFEVQDASKIKKRNFALRTKSGSPREHSTNKFDSNFPVFQVNNRSIAFEWAPMHHKNVLAGFNKLYESNSLTQAKLSFENLSGLSANMSVSDAETGVGVLLRPQNFIPESGVALSRADQVEQLSKTKFSDENRVGILINDDYKSTVRGQRLQEILEQNRRLSLEDMFAVLGDKKVNLGSIKPRIIQAISSLKDKHWLDVNRDFQAWNQQASIDARLPVLLNPLLDLLRKNTWDEIDFPGTTFPSDAILFSLLSDKPNDPILDIKSTTARETAEDIIKQSIDEAFRLNLVEHGNYPNWNWATANRLTSSTYFSPRFPQLITSTPISYDGFQNAISGINKGNREHRYLISTIADVRDDQVYFYVQGFIGSQENLLNESAVESSQRSWLDRVWRRVALDRESVVSQRKETITIKPAFQ